MFAKGHHPMSTQGLARNLGGYVRISVPVTPDPGAVANDRQQLRADAVVVPERPLDIALDPGDHLPDASLEEVKSLLHFMLDRRPFRPDFIGRNEQRDLSE